MSVGSESAVRTAWGPFVVHCRCLSERDHCPVLGSRKVRVLPTFFSVLSDVCCAKRETYLHLVSSGISKRSVTAQVVSIFTFRGIWSLWPLLNSAVETQKQA